MVDLNASNNVYSYFLGRYRQDLRPCFAELTPGIVEYIYDENCKLLSSSEGMLVPLIPVIRLLTEELTETT